MHGGAYLTRTFFEKKLPFSESNYPKQLEMTVKYLDCLRLQLYCKNKQWANQRTYEENLRIKIMEDLE